MRYALPLAALAALAAGCGDSPDRGADGRLQVFVSIEPQATFVERVGGDHVAVEVLVRPGQSPATYSPSLQQIERLARCDVYFRIGVPFEKSLVPKVQATMEEVNVVDTRRGIELRRMEGSHAHHDEGGHDHPAGAPDPHTWLDPRLVKRQASTICDELVRLDPQHEADYRGNLEAFHADLDRVHREVAQLLAPLEGRRMLVFHPAYGYFADAYGLEQVPVETEGKVPALGQLDVLKAQARREGFRVLFVQPQFAARNAQAVARELGLEVVRLDPLARDYLANLRTMATRIRDALGGEDS
ncbi:MAG: metal ABC transporter solute-binding protein, Zn/Mn family [Candidatus Brocadiia bacterium]